MLEILLYLILGISLITYSILIMFKKYRKLIISKNKFIRNISIIFGILTGLNSIMTSIALLIAETYTPSLCYKTNTLISSLIFVILYLLNVIGRKLDYKEKILTKSNITIIIIFIFMIIHLIRSISIPSVNYNEEKNSLIISDFLYHKELNLDEIDGISILDSIKEIDNSPIKLFNSFALKDIYINEYGYKVYVLNNLKSKCLIEIKSEMTYYQIGFLKESDCNKVYNFIKNYFENKLENMK